MPAVKTLDGYLESVKKQLGASWLASSEKKRSGYLTWGGIAKTHAVHCYMTDVTIKDCVKTIKTKLKVEDNNG